MSLASVRFWLFGFCVLIPSGLVAAPVQEGDKGQQATPVEKVRKSLQQPVTIEIKDKSLEQAIADLKDKTKINLVLDRNAIVTIDPNLQNPWQQFLPPGAVPPGQGAPAQPA